MAYTELNPEPERADFAASQMRENLLANEVLGLGRSFGQSGNDRNENRNDDPVMQAFGLGPVMGVLRNLTQGYVRDSMNQVSQAEQRYAGDGSNQFSRAEPGNFGDSMNQVSQELQHFVKEAKVDHVVDQIAKDPETAAAFASYSGKHLPPDLAQPDPDGHLDRERAQYIKENIPVFNNLDNISQSTLDAWGQISEHQASLKGMCQVMDISKNLGGSNHNGDASVIEVAANPGLGGLVEAAKMLTERPDQRTNETYANLTKLVEEGKLNPTQLEDLDQKAQRNS